MDIKRNTVFMTSYCSTYAIISNNLMNKPYLLAWIGLSWIMYPFLSWKSKIRDQKLGDDKRILVIPQYSRVGDIVCSTPVLYNLKRTFPNSYVSVLVSKKAIGILKNNPHIDEFIILEDYSQYGLINRLREGNFNWSINLSATSVNTCLALWACIANRIKTVVENRPITERMTDWMSNHKLLYRNHTYLPQHHINLLKFLKINSPVDKKEVFVSEKAEVKAQTWRDTVPKDSRIIGISITAGNKIKELGDDKFEILIKRLLEMKDIVVCIIGSKGDSERIEDFVNRFNDSRCIKSTDFNLEELPSLMKKFSLYVAVDTGPIYIAHALGIPLIDIIGPVDPNEQPPQDNKSIRVLPRGDVKPSSFVFKRRGEKSEIERAIKSINIDDVIVATKKLLG